MKVAWPHSLQRSPMVFRPATVAAGSPAGLSWPMCSASVRAIASGSDRILVGPKPVGWPPPIRLSWLMISSSRRWADRGEGSLRTSEISRPKASATAMVSEPPLPTWTKTSKGSRSGVSLTVMKAVPPRLDDDRARRRGGDRLVLLDADVQDLLALAAVAEDGDAQAAELPGQTIGTGDVLLGGTVGQVDGLADAVVGVALEGRLVAHVPLVADLVRGLEHARGVFRQPRDAVQRAPLRDLLHERIGVDPLLLGQPLEGLVDERH